MKQKTTLIICLISFFVLSFVSCLKEKSCLDKLKYLDEAHSYMNTKYQERAIKDIEQIACNDELHEALDTLIKLYRASPPLVYADLTRIKEKMDTINTTYHTFFSIDSPNLIASINKHVPKDTRNDLHNKEKDRIFLEELSPLSRFAETNYRKHVVSLWHDNYNAHLELDEAAKTAGRLKESKAEDTKAYIYDISDFSRKRLQMDRGAYDILDVTNAYLIDTTFIQKRYYITSYKTGKEEEKTRVIEFIGKEKIYGRKLIESFLKHPENLEADFSGIIMESDYKMQFITATEYEAGIPIPDQTFSLEIKPFHGKTDHPYLQYDEMILKVINKHNEKISKEIPVYKMAYTMINYKLE